MQLEATHSELMIASLRIYTAYHRATAGAPKLEDPDKIKSEPASEPTRLPRQNLKNLPEQERVAAMKEATKIRHTTLGSTRNGMLDDAIEASIANVGFNVWADPKKPGAMVWTVIGSHLAAAGVRLLGWDATVCLPPQMESKRGKSGLWKEEVAALRNALNARSILGAGLRYENFTYRAGDPVFVTHDYMSVPPDAKSPDFVAHWRTSIKRLPYIDGEDHMFVGQYDLRGIGPPSESRTPLYPPTLPANASDDDASDIEEIPPPARTSKHAPKTNAAAPAKSKSKSGDAAAKSKVSGKSNSKTRTKSADALPAKPNSRKRTAPKPESDDDELELESEEEEDVTATPVVTRSKSRSGTQVRGGVVPSEPLRLPTASVPTPVPFIDGIDVEVDTDYNPLVDNRDTRPKGTCFQDAELSGDSGRDESYMPPVPPDQPKKCRRTAAPKTSEAPDAHPELLPRPPPPQRYPVARPAYRGATASSRTAPSAPGSHIQPVASGSGQASGSRIPPVTSASTLQQRRPPYEVNGRLVRDPRDPPEVQNNDQRPRRPPRLAPPPVDLTAVQQALVNNPDAAQLLMSMFMLVLQGAAPPQNYGGDYDEYTEYEYTDRYPPNR
ncbi:hypothetical protein C8R43DRAFT_1142738 [Mycena crocata]|nr:hypothetical protein C8R43DRAFT_1142738 [Mycena crocata]